MIGMTAVIQDTVHSASGNAGQLRDLFLCNSHFANSFQYNNVCLYHMALRVFLQENVCQESVDTICQKRSARFGYSHYCVFFVR